MAAAGAAGLVLPVTVRGEPSVPGLLARPKLLEILRDERVVREIGQCYRQTVPSENDAHTLTRVISTDTLTATPAALRAELNKAVRRDFSDGRTVTLNGWVLSVTEARQCALFSLLPS